jgi:NAD+ synthase
MTTLYGIAAIFGNCLVVNTCNLSEDVVGYSTKFGDHAGDFSILNKLTKTEVRQIASDLGIDAYLVNKTPTDGMSLNSDGSLKSDEDKLGISYADLDKLIRTGEASDEVRSKVFKFYNANKHKFDLKLPSFDPKLPNYITEENLPKWTKSQCEDAVLW